MCGASILVVEDEVMLRILIAEELRGAGYGVVEAADADQALCALPGSLGVKVMVADIQMPGSMDGIALARAVRSSYPRIKIVLTSAHNIAIDEVEHDGFFRKPYNTNEIITHVGTLLA